MSKKCVNILVITFFLFGKEIIKSENHINPLQYLFLCQSSLSLEVKRSHQSVIWRGLSKIHERGNSFFFTNWIKKRKKGKKRRRKLTQKITRRKKISRVNKEDDKRKEKRFHCWSRCHFSPIFLLYSSPFSPKEIVISETTFTFHDFTLSMFIGLHG